MQIVIDIPNRIYKIIQNKKLNLMDGEILEKAVKNGTPLPKGHGRLIDAEKFESRMYHEAFETDSDLQRWNSGCWIRYKMFEQNIQKAETIIEEKLESGV